MTGGYFSSLLMIIQIRGRLTAVGELKVIVHQRPLMQQASHLICAVEHRGHGAMPQLTFFAPADSN